MNSSEQVSDATMRFCCAANGDDGMFEHVLPMVVLLLTLILWVVVVLAVQSSRAMFDDEKIYEPFIRAPQTN